MLRKIYAIVATLFLAGAALAQSGGVLKVKLVDKSNNEVIPFASVAVMSGGQSVISGVTDINGELVLKPIPAGKYDLRATYVGYQTLEVKGIIISDGKTLYQDNPPLGLSPTTTTLETVEIVDFEEPLIDPDTKSGGTVTRDEFEKMPSKDVNSVASTTAGVFQKDEGGAVNIRGQRSEGTAYYIDGQKVIGGSKLPQSSIEQISVITGGTPAMYGDNTGGIISVTTRGPQNEFFGGLEAIRSLDAYGYNFLGFSVGGPILQKKDSTGYKKSVLGFILSGEVVNEKDDNPSAVGTWGVNPDVLSRLENSPLRPATVGYGTYRNAEFLTKDSLVHYKYKQNVRNYAVRLNAKIDFKPTKNMNLTFGGSVDYYNRHDYIYEYSLLNPSNNPQEIGNTWRVYGKITQKFGSDEGKDEKSTSNIKNAYYTLQVGYTHYTQTVQDDDHKRDFFKYGYIGTYNTYRDKTYAFNENGLMGPAFYMSGFQDTLVTFTPGFNGVVPNQYGANYTSQYYSLVPGNPTTLGLIQQGGGLLNGDRPENVYSLFYNTGRQYGGYSNVDQTQFRVFTNFSADIKNHAIQVGFEYEQRTERYWSVAPIGLWTLMRQLANFHLTQLDVNNPIYAFSANGYDFYDYNRAVDLGSQKWFDKQLREKIGAGANEFIDVDALDPNLFNINMFSADDLLNSGSSYVTYYGYDIHGDKLKSNPSFDDFFTKQDANGNFSREIAPYQPIYVAGYIQDKFDFKDLKFNVGVRVDRFDANQKVLKDKYLLFDAKTIGEVDATENPNGSHPSNLSSTAVVYTNGNQNQNGDIVGYRDGDNWYDAQGVQISDPRVLADAAGGTIHPYLLDPTQKTVSSKSFKDYDPQVTFMPRIAFAFPISDVANFFAHYDVLTQRPKSFQRLDPTDYYFIYNRQGNVLDNPNLKPERTTDYELGFTQTLTEKKNSAITLSAFYREMRDMIQIINVNQAYPISYLTYGNIDFGTVKGFSVAYDLRRSGGVQMTASYTLQFADGTGSSASGGYNLVSSGLPNLRSTIPLDFDQRHTIVTNFDYRFGSGKNYRGPVWTKHKGEQNEKGLQLLQNVGANLVFRAGSGLPYTKQSNVTQAAAFGIAQRSTLKGSPNGANLPWQYRVDLRIDKNFELAFGKGEGDKKKMANLNVYLQVLNVLNTKNIINVYRYTGNPGDDGYLASPGAQSAIYSQVNPQSYIDLYSIKMNSPGNYSIPRRIRLGVQFDF
jgi:hypothetical protein